MLQRYFRNAGILGLTEVMVRLKNLVVIPILTNAFGAANFGIWVQVSVIVSMVIPLVVMGTDSAAFRYLPGQGKGLIQRGFCTLLSYYLLVSFVVSALLWVASEPMAAVFLQDKANARFVVLCGGSVFAGLLTNLCRSFYRLNSDGKMYAVINVTQSVVGSLVILGVVIAKGTIFQVLFLALLTDLILGLAMSAHILRRNGLVSPDRALLVRFLRFGLPLVPAGYAMFALNMADRLFISYYLTLQDLGVYSVIYGIGYMSIGLIFNPIWLMYPTTAASLFNQGLLSELSGLYRQSTRLALGLLVPAMVGVTVLNVPIVRMLSTEEFVRGAPLVLLITLAYTFHMLSSYFDVSLGFTGQQGWSTFSICIAAGVNVGLSYLLIPRWGLTGAAWATLTGFLVQFCLSAWVGSRRVRLVFDWRFLGKSCLSSLGMAAVLALLPAQIPRWLIVVYIGIGISVFGLLMKGLKAFEPREWQLLMAPLGNLRTALGALRLMGKS